MPISERNIHKAYNMNENQSGRDIIILPKLSNKYNLSSAV